MGWKLKRVRQCDKCPWKTSTNPYDIPDGYSEDLHRSLASTIAEPGSLRQTGAAMACHEHAKGEEVHCVGWVYNQMTVGNNIPLRMQLLSCENLQHLKTEGPQHERFEDTLPD